MQDRFRFRAWQKDYQKMYYDVEMTYDYPYEPRGAEQSSFGAVLENDDYVVMQCTGLKDKNGKLIYEGDIVKNLYNNKIGTVEWDNYIDSENYYNYSHLGWIAGYVGETSAVATITDFNYEVVGNVYQNKELLEDNNG